MFTNFQCYLYDKLELKIKRNILYFSSHLFMKLRPGSNSLFNFSLYSSLCIFVKMYLFV